MRAGFRDRGYKQRTPREMVISDICNDSTRIGIHELHQYCAQGMTHIYRKDYNIRTVYIRFILVDSKCAPLFAICSYHSVQVILIGYEAN